MADKQWPSSTLEYHSKIAPPKCSFFLKRKNRYCKMIPAKNSKYCGEHSWKHEGSDKRKRIPCPLDTKHTVFEDQLQKHLKKCNVTKKTQIISEYYDENINTGLLDTSSPVEKRPLRNIPTEDILLCIQKIRNFFKENPLCVRESFLSEKNIEDKIKEASPSLAKHLEQQSSLIGNMRNMDLLTSNSIFVEFGAGRGMLSHWVQKSLEGIKNVDFLLIDRASNRYKADSYHRGTNQGPSFNRIQIDIEHLNLKKVPLISNSSQYVTGVSKHLCGAATDLALRCLLSTTDVSQLCSSNYDEEKKTSKKLKVEESRVNGLVFALCCHHCCSWNTYVAREFLQSLGFTPYLFRILCGLTSWAICGCRKKASKKRKNTEENEETLNEAKDIKHALNDNETMEASCIRSLGLSKDESVEIGRLSKRLIDVGRVSYLVGQDLEASLVYYVTSSVSLENVALLARSKHATHTPW